MGAKRGHMANVRFTQYNVTNVSSRETTELRKEERWWAFRTGFGRRIWFFLFQISGAPSTAAMRDSVGHLLHHRSTLVCGGVRTEEWCEVSAERVSFSSSRSRCVGRLHVLGVVNR
ncbi:unnamed protein product [Brassica oleracea]